MQLFADVRVRGAIVMRRENSHREADHKADAVSSVYDFLVAQSQRFANSDLLVVPESVRQMWALPQQSWTYSQTLDCVKQLAARYHAAGYRSGHRVALVLESRPVHFFHWLALNAVGASAVPINPDYTQDELAFVLNHSDTALVICLEARQNHVTEAAARLGIAVAQDDTEEFPSAPTPDPAMYCAPSECALIYTSGTTGRPKGCMLSNSYFLGWAEWYVAQRGLISLREGSERLMTPLPAFHVNAIGHSFMGMLGSGGAQIIIDRFHPRDWWATAIETGATCFHYLGVMPAILLEIPPSENDRMHHMRFGVGGGVHPDHHATFEERFGVPLLEGWAMTETGAAGLLCSNEEPRHIGKRCIGKPDRPGPAMEIRLIGDDGNDATTDMPGELVLRATGNEKRRRFFSGYLKDDDATGRAWADGWLHTGDIMRQGNDGSLYFVDRKKNIIRRSGENIAAVEVEAAIVSHPGTAKVAVVAVPDPIRGEEVLAAIVPSDSGQMTAALAEDIFRHCLDRLAYFKLPGYIVLLDELPVTSTQKIRKTDLGDFTEKPWEYPECIDFRAEKQRQRGRGS